MSGLAPSYVSLIRRNPGFRRLWLGQVVSFLGDWFTLLALYDIVQTWTTSALALAGVHVAKMLPIFLVSPVAGPLIDRFDRRKLMLATDFLRAALALGLVAAHQLGSLPLLFTLLVLQMAVAGIFIPARTAVIPQLTSPQELPVAMALSAGTWSTMLALGAALGGAATAWLGPDGALVLDAATFLASAALLWRLPPLPPREDAARPSRDETSFRDGLRHLARRPYLATVLSLKTAMGLGSGVLVMIPLFGNGVFPATAGPLFVGVLYAFRGVGALIGSMGVRVLAGDRPQTMRRMVTPAYLVTAASLVALSLSPGLWVAAAWVLAAGIGNGLVWVLSGTLAQQASEQAYRGRAFALEFGVMTLMTSSMGFLSGAAVDGGFLDPRGVALWSGFALLLPAVAWLVALRLLRRQFPAPTPA